MNEFVKTFEALEQPWTPEEFEAAAFAPSGPERYHDNHEFISCCTAASSTRARCTAWALNRYVLSGSHSAQGCGAHEPHLRPRAAPRVDPSHARPRRPAAGGAWRHRALARCSPIASGSTATT